MSETPSGSTRDINGPQPAGLAVTDLSAWYAQAQALRNVTLSVDEGDIVGVFGRNGAGKTTLLRAIARLHTAMTGTMAMGGVELHKLTTTSVARQGLSLVREGAVLPLTLTVEENVKMGASLCKLRRVDPRTLDEIWETFPLLAQLRTKRAGVLSGGQRQTLALAVAYISRPKLLLLDEPSAGLSPQTSRSVFEVIRQLADTSGVTALIVEQRPAYLEGIAKRNYLLELGEVVGEGSTDELMHKVQEER